MYLWTTNDLLHFESYPHLIRIYQFLKDSSACQSGHFPQFGSASWIDSSDLREIFIIALFLDKELPIEFWTPDPDFGSALAEFCALRLLVFRILCAYSYIKVSMTASSA